MSRPDMDGVFLGAALVNISAVPLLVFGWGILLPPLVAAAIAGCWWWLERSVRT